VPQPQLLSSTGMLLAYWNVFLMGIPLITSAFLELHQLLSPHQMYAGRQ